MYCGYCGKQLESEHDLICRDCGSRVGNDINYCTNCGGLRKNKKKKTCVFCGHIFYTVQSNNNNYRKFSSTNNKINSKGGLIFSSIFMLIWLGTSIRDLYGDLTATTGYFSSKTSQYISVADRHANVPVDLFFVGIGIFFLISLIRGFLNSRK
ncbi:hypothetical protein [Clostridium thermobutyricum]|uniref:Double zinc ribbon n=1 Tax=Clostridium thermobutyricum DSM 4928 TaxID=1121339 RepID=A0A1V4SW05_9CLOT|nr:hypothetical protein [Clostridium thermobutyricum]OPX47479.1 double zinc ribbon [Clostridium thermobutyricum DSM 4928]